MELPCFLKLSRSRPEYVGAEVVARHGAVRRLLDSYAVPGCDLQAISGPLGNQGRMDAKALSKRNLTPDGVYGMSDRGHARKLRLAKHACQ